MKEVSVSKFKATCLELLRDVAENGEPILVTKRGEPIAEVRPPHPKGPNSLHGCMKGRGKILGDITSPAIPAEKWDVLKREDPS